MSQAPVPEPVQPSAQPQPLPPIAPPQPEPKAEAPAAVPVQELEPALEAPKAFTRPYKLTAKTLAGTKWKGGIVEVAFLPDGRWQMNGRICAKWAVEGNRVRIYDGEGEEHFLDIDGDSLTFNGEKIGRMPN